MPPARTPGWNFQRGTERRQRGPWLGGGRSGTAQLQIRNTVANPAHEVGTRIRLCRPIVRIALLEFFRSLQRSVLEVADERVDGLPGSNPTHEGCVRVDLRLGERPFASAADIFDSDRNVIEADAVADDAIFGK